MGERCCRGPLPFWLGDGFLYLAILARSTTMPVKECSQTSCVTVKICTIDEAASEAVAAWECMGEKPIDETNYESRASMSCTLIGQVKGTSFRMRHGGGGRSPGPENLVCGGVDNPRSSSKWDRHHRRSHASRAGQCAKIFMHGRL
jgi:hypothetical protein